MNVLCTWQIFLAKRIFFLSPNSNIKDVEKYIILFYFILFFSLLSLDTDILMEVVLNQYGKEKKKFKIGKKEFKLFLLLHDEVVQVDI